MPGIKHPARHYINYLVSRRTHDPKTIIDTLIGLGYPMAKFQVDVEAFISQLKPLRQQMVFPARFNPRSSEPNEATEAFLRKWAIVAAWRPDAHMFFAMDMLCDPQIKHALQLMLLSPLSTLTIAERLRKRFNLPTEAMNAGVVRAYGHYFWDQGALSAAEWKEYLDKHMTQDSFDYMCMLQVPNNRAGAAFALAVADKDTSLLAPAERYTLVSAAGFKRFMEHIMEANGRSGTFAAYTALNIMRLGDEELQKYQGGSTELMEELRRMETRYDPSKPLNIEDMGFMRPILTTTAEPVEEPSGDE